MKLRDCTPEQKAWEIFKLMCLNSIFVSFGLGMLIIIFPNLMPYSMLFMIICPVGFFVTWYTYANKFLKEEIKPCNGG